MFLRSYYFPTSSFCYICTYAIVEPPSHVVVFAGEMETETFASSPNGLYPMLVIPKTCTTFETNCEASDNVFINLTITSPDTEGNETCIYTGFCNIKLIDTVEVIQDDGETAASSDREDQHDANKREDDKDQNEEIYTGIESPPYSQYEVWIDPATSPYVYNSCDTSEIQEQISVYHETHSNYITVEQHNTYITQNVHKCNDNALHCYSPANEFEHKKFRKAQNDTSNVNCLTDEILYQEDEVECGVFLTKLPKEIWNENEARARKERQYIGVKSNNDALNQLMSSDIQSVSKQQKTILFLGHDSHFGHTVQKITYNDPYLKCTGLSESGVDHEIVIDNTIKWPNQKKYQCDKCKQIFDQIVDFRKHMVGSHKVKNTSISSDVKFMCFECGKRLKNQERFEQHCHGHGDPELQCNNCHKVFASKFTLRNHKRVHQRRHHSDTFRVLSGHMLTHGSPVKELSDTEYYEAVIGDADTMSMVHDDCDREVIVQDDNALEISRANSVIAKVVANDMFLICSKKKRGRKYKNTCDVCLKFFDRVGDLKRHLIEHIIRSTLAKNPVGKNGTLSILCEVCQAETFSKVDKYKAHLREHANLTLYKCTFCDKSFSDSSNFSKHKKIHGIVYFQCDLCQRKFNSKKMLTIHMEYHNNNDPVKCHYCDKEFYFESMLNKHIKLAHALENPARFRCRFCDNFFKSLKDKWDHDWTAHKIRKMVVDCMLCEAKFRKYSELKRHCTKFHDIDIPPANKLLKKK